MRQRRRWRSGTVLLTLFNFFAKASTHAQEFSLKIHKNISADNVADFCTNLAEVCGCVNSVLSRTMNCLKRQFKTLLVGNYKSKSHHCFRRPKCHSVCKLPPVRSANISIDTPSLTFPPKSPYPQQFLLFPRTLSSLSNMVRKQPKQSKQDKLLAKAISSMEELHLTRRQAASIARLPLSTFQYQLKKRNNTSNERTYLSPVEEGKVVARISRYAERGFNISRADVATAVEDLVKSFPLERQKKIPFIDGKPGRCFLRLLAKKNQHLIRFGRASKQEQARWRATNADNLTSHFVQIEAIIRDHSIDPSRLAKLAETGTTPENGCTQSVRSKGYYMRGNPPEQQAPVFSNVKRITMLPVIFAVGNFSMPMFVIQGTRVKFRIEVDNGTEVVETLADCLLRGSVITKREDVAIVDSVNFLNWAKMFVHDVKDFTANGRKVLLILDGRCHMI